MFSHHLIGMLATLSNCKFIYLLVIRILLVKKNASEPLETPDAPLAEKRQKYTTNHSQIQFDIAQQSTINFRLFVVIVWYCVRYHNLHYKLKYVVINLLYLTNFDKPFRCICERIRQRLCQRHVYSSIWSIVIQVFSHRHVHIIDEKRPVIRIWCMGKFSTKSHISAPPAYLSEKMSWKKACHTYFCQKINSLN